MQPNEELRNLVEAFESKDLMLEPLSSVFVNHSLITTDSLLELVPAMLKFLKYNHPLAYIELGCSNIMLTHWTVLDFEKIEKMMISVCPEDCRFGTHDTTCNLWGYWYVD